MIPESNELNDYLVSDSVVDWKNPVILDKANQLTSKLSDETEISVYNTISYQIG